MSLEKLIQLVVEEQLLFLLLLERRFGLWITFSKPLYQISPVPIFTTVLWEPATTAFGGNLIWVLLITALMLLLLSWLMRESSCSLFIM